MICPKCNTKNEKKYSFCLECGTNLSTTPNVSNEEPPTVQIPLDKLPTNQANTSEDSFADEIPTIVRKSSEISPTVHPQEDNSLPKTEFYSSAETSEHTNKQTEIIPSEELPATAMFSSEDLVGNEPQPTEDFSSEDSVQTELPQTEMYSSRKTVEEAAPSPTHFSNQEEIPKHEEVPPKSIENVSKTNISAENIEISEKPKKKPRRFRKFLLVFTGFLLLLLVGGGAAAYFLLPPPQKSRSYFLFDKHQKEEKVLDFDDKSDLVFMKSPEKNLLQSWQITPNPDDKNYYRFVNRGVGNAKSFEVVDDKFDSSVSMAKSAIDDGQSWSITNVQGDYYRITNKWLGESKSLSHNKRKFYFLRIRDTKNTPGQLWKRTPAKNGGYFISNRRYGNKLALEAIAEGDFANKLRMSESAGLDNQKWEFKPVGSGYFNLTSKKGNKFLDVNPSKKDRIRMADSGNSAGQKWKFTPVGNDYYRITNESLGEGKSLEAVTFSKYIIEMVKTSDKDSGQIWKIERISR